MQAISNELVPSSFFFFFLFSSYNINLVIMIINWKLKYMLHQEVSRNTFPFLGCKLGHNPIFLGRVYFQDEECMVPPPSPYDGYWGCKSAVAWKLLIPQTALINRVTLFLNCAVLFGLIEIHFTFHFFWFHVNQILQFVVVQPAPDKLSVLRVYFTHFSTIFVLPSTRTRGNSASTAHDAFK